MKRLIFALFGVLFATSAFAQGTIIQSGPVTQLHAGGWLQNGFLMDGGSPPSPYISALGLFGGSTCPLGVSSQPSPGAPPTQYSLFQVCQTNSATTFYINSFGGLPPPLVQFSINGVITTFPQNNPSNPPRIILSGAADTAAAQNVTIMWKSSTALAKTQNLPVCNSSNVGIEITVLDDKGNAGTYPINIAPNGLDTITNHFIYVISSDNGGFTMQCDGLGNWAGK